MHVSPTAFYACPEGTSGAQLCVNIAPRAHMGWRHMLFVMDHPSQVGPRLLRKLAELARGCDADLELYQPAFEWGMHKGGIGSVASDIETRETLARRDSE